MALAGIAAFIAAVTLSAALLFTVEPMIAKMLLPHFGGASSVWSVALVFFQAALLAGYFYAHVLVRAAPGWRGVAVHLGVLGLGILALPFAVSPGATQMTGSAPLNVLLTLAVVIGLPFTALAANAPLLQAWYAQSRLAGAHNPYPLYAASNAGSLMALLAYPVLIEPGAALRAQTWGWTIAYGALIVLIGVAIWLGRPLNHQHTDENEGPAAPPRWQLAWLGLALLPSAGLVAVTAHISSNVAAAPFLWVLPLSVYLITFVIAFSGRGQLFSKGAQVVLPLALLAVALAQATGLRLGFFADIGLHLIAFFLIALVAHWRLAALRPPVAGLTRFYLVMSLGGLIGGVATAIVAPAVFSFVAEYPLIILAAALLTRWPLPVLALVAALMIVPAVLEPRDAPGMHFARYRSFYGVHAVETTADGQYRVLRHGNEIHGAQQVRDERGTPLTGKPQPLTYYHEEGAVSEAIDAARAVAGGAAMDVGVVGLGAGSMACLVESRDRLSFYEIDPQVIRLAEDRANFTFLADCGPRPRIVEGDARLSLSRETTRFDVLVIDAFSSDSIPAHLLTREALEIYMARLKPHGMLVLHISNDHIRLNDIVAATARQLGQKVLIFDEDAPQQPPRFVYQPTVAAIARQSADFGPLASSDEWLEPPQDAGATAWSDDYSNLLSAILSRLNTP